MQNSVSGRGTPILSHVFVECSRHELSAKKFLLKDPFSENVVLGPFIVQASRVARRMCPASLAASTAQHDHHHHQEKLTRR